MREQPEQQAPPVQRLRIRYAKRDGSGSPATATSPAPSSARCSGRVSMAYSSGFNPHPRISYAGAAPTGSASEAEYLEIALAEQVDPVAVHAALDEALPDGLDVLEVVQSPGGSLSDRLEASVADHPDRRTGGRGRLGGRGVPRHGRGLRRTDDEEGAAHLRLPRGGRVARITRYDGIRDGVCDTRLGLATRNPVRETRRRPRRTPRDRRTRGWFRSRTRATGPGSSRRADRHGGRSVGARPRRSVTEGDRFGPSHCRPRTVPRDRLSDDDFGGCRRRSSHGSVARSRTARVGPQVPAGASTAGLRRTGSPAGD